MKKIIWKISVVFLSAFLIAPYVFNCGYVVHAESYAITQESSLSEEELQLSSALQFIFDNATTYDSKGYVKDIDFSVIYEKYGYSEDLAKVEKIITSEKYDRADIGHCTVVAIQDTLGVSAINGLISGGIVGLLQRKAAAEIAKLVAKYAFKNIVPAAAAASLIWSFGRCMWF